MIRKDYVLIAETLRNCQPTKSNRAPYAMWELIVENMAKMLKADNSDFQSDKFYRAASYRDTEFCKCGHPHPADHCKQLGCNGDGFVSCG